MRISTRFLFRITGLIAACAILILISTQCKKDPVNGWTFYEEVPPPPEITSMTGVVKNCVPPYPVTFYQEVLNDSIGNCVYTWDFGDGTTSHDLNPGHIFANPGNYKISLTVENEVGRDTMSIVLSELSQTSIPIVSGFNFTHFNSNVFAPNKVIFTNTSSGANQFYWYFGDGLEDNDDAPEHIFQDAGTYTVMMRGTCTDGSYDEVTQQILIGPPPTRVVVDSLTLMLPSSNSNIYIELWHNTTIVGRTSMKSGSFPMKFKAPGDFYDGHIFEYVQFTGNEVFKFYVLKDVSPDPPILLYEILLSSSYIQSRFYPDHYYQIETVPALQDVFIDLYMSY